MTQPLRGTGRAWCAKLRVVGDASAPPWWHDPREPMFDGYSEKVSNGGQRDEGDESHEPRCAK